MQRLTSTEREPYLKFVQDMIGIAYADIGLPAAQDILAKYPVWYMAENLTACWLAKETAYGTKMCLCGHDGSRAGKLSICDVLRTLSKATGFYAEVSGKVEAMAAEMALPKVLVWHAQTVLGKPITALDIYRYRREITGLGRVVKVMIGTPNL